MTNSPAVPPTPRRPKTVRVKPVCPYTAEDFIDESDIDVPMSDELVARIVARLRPYFQPQP